MGAIALLTYFFPRDSFWLGQVPHKYHAVLCFPCMRYNILSECLHVENYSSLLVRILSQFQLFPATSDFFKCVESFFGSITVWMTLSGQFEAVHINASFCINRPKLLSCASKIPTYIYIMYLCYNHWIILSFNNIFALTMIAHLNENFCASFHKCGLFQY